MNNIKKINFVVCVDNSEYPESLENFKIYKTLSDSVAASKGYIRIIDESGEDYIYDESYFIPINPPTIVKSYFLKMETKLAL